MYTTKELGIKQELDLIQIQELMEPRCLYFKEGCDDQQNFPNCNICKDCSWNSASVLKDEIWWGIHIGTVDDHHHDATLEEVKAYNLPSKYFDRNLDCNPFYDWQNDV